MIKRGRSPLDYEYGRHFPGEAGKYRQKDLEKSYMTERNIQGLSEKVFLRLEAPSEEEHVSDQMRIRQGLEEKGYRNIRFSLEALRTLYPLCREAGWEITVTLVHEEQGILITAVEAGDRTREHYGLAVDYGSTTILMQIVDMNAGEVRKRARRTDRRHTGRIFLPGSPTGWRNRNTKENFIRRRWRLFTGFWRS